MITAPRPPAGRLGSLGFWLWAWTIPATAPWAAPAARSAWEPVGLSGGGAMFSPAISPADPKRMMVHCDMGAAYVTADGGRSWRMIPVADLPSNTRCRPVFHPTDPKTIFSPAGWSGQIRVTHDGGERWETLGGVEGTLTGGIAVDPGNPSLMLAGSDEAVWISPDGGRTWKRCDGPRGEPVGFHIDQTSPPDRRVCLAATNAGVWRSDDGGATWTGKTRGLPSKELRGFAGASSLKAKAVVLYCTVPSRADGGRYEGGVFRSMDRGETWESAMGAGLNMETKAFDEWAMGPVAQYHGVLAADTAPMTVWAFNANTGIPPPHHASAYRSDDGGRTWRATFQADPRWKPCTVEADYVVAVDGQFYQDNPRVAVCPSNPDVVIAVDDGHCYVTRDGGKSWQCGHARPAAGTGRDSTWLCNGLVVTTTWHYDIDPSDPHRHFINYTDIGFARSTDAGKTWSWWPREGRAPWANTCYELAFDPETPGKVWGAFSNVHDIPNGNIIFNRHRGEGAGGICLSTDAAATWRPLAGGLPEAPATAIVLDRKSPRDRRTFYAGFFGRGVYRSMDDGKTWEARNSGLGAPSNLRVCRVQIHPDGTLFALVTARVEGRTFQPEGVGLYRSKDGGGAWEKANKGQPFLWPKDFALDPKDSRTIYVGACDANGKQDGGLYRSTDGGATWTRLAREGPEHFGAALHPKKPGWIYMTLCEGAPGAGLWLSKDSGKSFAPAKDLPFNNIMRVTFDPKNENVIYVSTFGGSVWKGPAGW